MAANTSPIFTITPVVGAVRIATANTGRDGTGTLNTLATGGANGTRIDRIVMIAQGTTVASMIRFFIWDGTAVTHYFWREQTVSAITPSGTVQAFTATILSPDPTQPLLVLPQNYVLQCAPNDAQTFDVTAFGGNF